MKKIAIIFITVVALLAGTYVGAAFVCGIMAERQINEIVYGSAARENIDITDYRYDRGVFSSTVHTAVETAVPQCEDPSEKLSLTLKNYVKHGPWPFGKSVLGYTYTKPVLAVIETTVSPTAGATGEIQKVCNKFLRRASVLNRTVINFSAGGESTLTVNAFSDTYGEKKENTVTWKGLESQFSFSRGFKEIKGTVKLPGFDVRAPAGSFTMGDMRCSVDVHEAAENFYLGTSSFSMDLMEIVHADAENRQRFRMRTLFVNSSTQESNNTMSSRNTMDVAAIVMDDTIVGPIHCALEFRNLDVPSLIKLSNSYREIQKTAGRDPEADIDELLAGSYLDVLPGLLKASPQIELKDLKVKTNQGDISGELSIICDGTKIEANLNPFTIFGALSASLECTMASGLFLDILTFTKKEMLMKAMGQSVRAEEIEAKAREESKQQMDFLLARNILVQVNGTLSLKARYENGIILINDQPMPLFNLLQQEKM